MLVPVLGDIQMPASLINIYCDESCHLEHDNIPYMFFGAIWGAKDHIHDANREIRSIKDKHNARGELKWGKVSESRLPFFLNIVEYFFENPELHFRCVIVNDKAKLNHTDFNDGDHDAFYYKMNYFLLKTVMAFYTQKRFNIYLDLKDTRSQIRIDNLSEILSRTFLDFDYSIIHEIKHVRSQEVELIQFADFFTGAVAYHNRGLNTSKSKLSVIDEITRLSGKQLSLQTPPWESKFNLFFFDPK